MEPKPMSRDSYRSNGPTKGLDRRTEQRTTVNEEGLVSLAGPEPLMFRCRLLDISRHGFRAVHDHAELAPGSQIRLRSSLTGEVQAMVIWTAIVSQHVESGFYIIES
jgi:hypothetical protein